MSIRKKNLNDLLGINKGRIIPGTNNEADTKSASKANKSNKANKESNNGFSK